MNPTELKQRTKKFALRILKLVTALPNTIAGRAVGSQIVGAEHRWPLIIERLVARGLKLNSSLKSE